MYQLLKKGQEINLSTGNVCVVTDFFGSGTQGEVYKVKSQQDVFALKWYFPNSATMEQRKIIEELLRIGEPNESFLWPLALANKEGVSGFGYLMPVRSENYHSINMLVRRKIEPSFHALITACYNLADSFFQLHSKGLAYKDISFGNAFINPSNGDILICDNDNACYDGQDLSTIGGTPRFMAPEIVQGNAMPSKYTDLFSLGILLFYMLYMSHPLMGKKEMSIHALDDKALKKLFGDEPLFIFDPHDRSNRPDPVEHQNALIFWKIYPQFINNLFTELFTSGLRNSKSRVAETVWRKAFIKLRDNIVYCSNCGSENFYDKEKLKDKQALICWNDKCRSQIKLPFRIKLNRHVVMLTHKTKLFPHHTHDQPNDFSEPTAEVVINKKNNLWGLRNLTKVNWTINANDKVIIVEPNRAATLKNGLIINFGGVTGEVRL